MALGAQRGHLLRIVIFATAISVSSPIVAGLALSFVLYRIFARWVENNSSDAIALVAGTLLLGCWPRPQPARVSFLRSAPLTSIPWPRCGSTRATVGKRA
jgi:hypothetical protein